ncbi:Hypothetical predicted protein [Octopus vulgaris]|uniref:Uncharacterized protein n=1 Tax=Octopus vulgaris TaxID=6645 RepID=A0AA36FH52_OCTVU|nr:Hypothetical predicted protein [Octopus vulgaris]
MYSLSMAYNAAAVFVGLICSPVVTGVIDVTTVVAVQDVEIVAFSGNMVNADFVIVVVKLANSDVVLLADALYAIVVILFVVIAVVPLAAFVLDTLPVKSGVANFPFKVRLGLHI